MPVTININNLSLCHKGSGGMSTATIPDVCKTPSPGGPVPIPYPNIATEQDLMKGTTTIKADGGMMCAIYGSEFFKSTGDEPGVAGGVLSSTFIKEATWITFSFDVKLQGKGACRLTDKMFHNHQNTVNCAGKIHAPVTVVSDPNANTIVCKAGQLEVQNNNAGPDRDCTHKHEASHAADWKDRYGDDLCKGVPDGKLPVGGDGYDEFLKESELKAYKVGLSCREELLKSASDKDKPAIQKAIDRDKVMIKKYGG